MTETRIHSETGALVKMVESPRKCQETQKEGADMRVAVKRQKIFVEMTEWQVAGVRALKRSARRRGGIQCPC
jgi:hypothetical protein